MYDNETDVEKPRSSSDELQSAIDNLAHNDKLSSSEMQVLVISNGVDKKADPTPVHWLA